MTLVDVVLALVLLFGLVVGWRRGLLASTADLIGLAVALAAALWGWRPLAEWFDQQGLPFGPWATPLAFFGLYVLVRILVGALLGRALAAAPEKLHRHAVNRLLGLVPGAVHGLVNAVLVMLLWQALPLGQTWERGAPGSVLARLLVGPAAWAEAALGPVFEPVAGQAWRLRQARVVPEAKTLKLEFGVEQAPARPELEARMLMLLNEARQAQGLTPLQADPEATELSRAHSQDMLSQRYFSHVSPQGQDPFDRLQSAGLRFRAAGENLALAPTVRLAHEGLMKSPGHRANILRPGFGRVGIGILDAGRHGLMVTQTFRN
jgi:uncharacterized protein YkwD/uncharacterized membrane protein required for colicin V production